MKEKNIQSESSSYFDKERAGSEIGGEIVNGGHLSCGNSDCASGHVWTGGERTCVAEVRGSDGQEAAHSDWTSYSEMTWSEAKTEWHRRFYGGREKRASQFPNAYMDFEQRPVLFGILPYDPLFFYIFSATLSPLL